MQTRLPKTKCVWPMKIIVICTVGVNIDKKLNFDSYVSYLCKKTSRQVNALSRLRHIANENSKNMLYKTYIVSNFNYCSAIWNYCSSKSIIKLEKLNKRALRMY